jgi:hypothetical protein
MSTIVTRSGKGSPLTHTEVDNNFTNLNTDKYQSGNNASFGTLSASGAFSANGGTTLGDASGDALTINSSAVSIPNGLNFDSNTLVIDATNNRVGIGTASPLQRLDVNGSDVGDIAVFSGATRGVRIGANSTNGSIEGVSDDGFSSFQPLAVGGLDVRFTTSGTERMRINTSGNVGIGTSSIGSRLDVSSGATTITSRLSNTGTNTYTPTASTSLVNSTFQLTGGNASGATTGIRMSQGGSFELYMGGVQEAGGAAAFVFQGYSGSSYAERMRIDSSGNVGIGISTPQSKMQVSSGANPYVVQNSGRAVYGIDIQATAGGSGAFGGAISFGNGGNGRSAISAVQGTADSDTAGLSFFVHTSSLAAADAVEAMRITSAGNVGIGTSSPESKFHVVGSEIRLTGSASKASMNLRSSSGAGSWIHFTEVSVADRYLIGHAAGSADLVFRSNSFDFSSGTERMRIDSSGNLLVGTTTSPSGSGRLAVGAGAWIPNTNYIQLMPKFTGSNGDYYFYDSNDGFFAFPDNYQKLGNPSYRWTTVYATTGTINTSDQTEKQQIADLTAAELATAVAIKGLIKSYKFNDSVEQKGDGARIHIGVIAQEVKAAFEANSLDASRYAMFCSDTWYEVDGKAKQEDGDFYTKETPNAVEVTRLGIRYEELLAFVISAL